jgi:hypothetical protein
MSEKLERFWEFDADDGEPTTIDFGRVDRVTVDAFSFAGEREFGCAEDRHMDRNVRNYRGFRENRVSDATIVGVLTGTVSPLPLFQTLRLVRQKLARASRACPAQGGVILINRAGQNKVRQLKELLQLFQIL